MGNSESSNVTIEREEDDYILTNEGVKLSPALLEQMVSQQPSKDDSEYAELYKSNLETIQKKLKEETAVAEETRNMLHAREDQMNKLNESWKKRLEDERNKYEEFNKLTIEEFQKAAENVEKKFIKPKLSPICANLQDAMISCYNDNPTTTLNCSAHVNDFSKCVEQAKEAYLNKRNNLDAH